MGTDLLGVASVAIVTVTVIFAVLVGVGFWMLAKRRAIVAAVDPTAALHTQANILLVRADDAVRNASDELGFAVAQFGDAKSQDFERALRAAKEQLQEAFQLQQKLDDAFPDNETQRRDWNSRIINLCTTAQSALAEQEQAFTSLRQLEQNAPRNLTAARNAIMDASTRMTSASSTLEQLRHDYSADALASVADNMDRAKLEITAATRDANTAEKALASPTTDSKSIALGGGLATESIRTAGEHAYRASKLLDAVDSLRDELDKARDAVTALRDSTSKNIAEAKSVRDAPPDPETGRSVTRTIAAAEKSLTTDSGIKDPIATLEVLRIANAELDASLGGARNQQQRLDGARTALVGALVSAKSQITATRNYIDNRRGGVGSEARTRLAEAERLLAVAESESDPVAALDTARSSATYSRDADALARYDLMRR